MLFEHDKKMGLCSLLSKDGELELYLEVAPVEVFVAAAVDDVVDAFAVEDAGFQLLRDSILRLTCETYIKSGDELHFVRRIDKGLEIILLV